MVSLIPKGHLEMTIKCFCDNCGDLTTNVSILCDDCEFVRDKDRAFTKQMDEENAAYEAEKLHYRYRGLNR